jgi:drug/metabolite transporter (DMT)-like permease
MRGSELLHRIGQTRRAGVPQAHGQLLPVLALVFLFLLWSNSFHAIAYLRRSVGAWDLVVLRFAPVAVFSLTWILLHDPLHNLRILIENPVRIAFLGLLIVPIYNVLLNWGQGQVPAGTASLLIAMNPLFTYALALVIRQERHRLRKSVGLMLSFTGVYLLLIQQGRSFGPGYGLHALSVLAAPLSWAIATIVAKPLVTRESPLGVTYLSLAVGSVPFLLIAPFDHTLRVAIGGFTLEDWFAITHLSLMCTIIGFAIWYASLRRLPASSVAAFVLLNPPMTIAFGPLWGTDQPTASVIGFGAWILAGIILSTWRIPDTVTNAGNAVLGVLDSIEPSVRQVRDRFRGKPRK